MLDEADDTSFDPAAIADASRPAHATGRAVAIHCVSRVEVVVAIDALTRPGPVPGDRLEHASVLPLGLEHRLRELGVAVVTQPNFIAERGDAYARDVDADDLEVLYRCRTLLAAGVAVAGGTDAPFGIADPWRAMRAAVERRSHDGCGARRGQRPHTTGRARPVPERPPAPGGAAATGAGRRARRPVPAPRAARGRVTLDAAGARHHHRWAGGARSAQSAELSSQRASTA